MVAKFPKNEEYKEARNKSDVAQKGISNWNPVEKDGRVHDRWYHEANPSRESFIGKDGVSYWERRYDAKAGGLTDVMIAKFEITDEKGREVLMMYAKDHEAQDNHAFNWNRMKDYGYENKRTRYDRCGECFDCPMDSIEDPDYKDMLDLAFPGEAGPSRYEMLQKAWRHALKQVAGDKFWMYERRYVDGASVADIVEDYYLKTGKRVSNQAISDAIMKMIRKAYKVMTGEDMQRLRDR